MRVRLAPLYRRVCISSSRYTLFPSAPVFLGLLLLNFRSFSSRLPEEEVGVKAAAAAAAAEPADSEEAPECCGEGCRHCVLLEGAVAVEEAAAPAPVASR